MDPALVEPLPTLYAAWLQELVGAQPPREAEATCGSCAMCRDPSDTGPPLPHYFEPDRKCCTYLPRLPNFLVGGILTGNAPDDEMGRVSVAERISKGHGVTPLGVGRSPVYDALYDKFAPEAFGASAWLTCPHLTGDARCGIHAHRNSTCSTWFCKHVRGAVGERFWSALREWLWALEREISMWCVLDAGLGAVALERLLPARQVIPEQDPDARERLAAALDGRSIPTDARTWGVWHGRETEYFIRCGERVRSLAWPAIAAIGGASVAAWSSRVRSAYEQLVDETLPSHLLPATLRYRQLPDGDAIVTTYLESDPLRLSEDVLRVLPCFEGRSVDDALRHASETLGLDVDPLLVRRLADFGVLKPPEGA